MNQHDRAIKRIRSNIEQDGFHLYQILPDSTPGYFYTVGLTEKIGAEVVLAGGAYFQDAERIEIVRRIATKVASGGISDIVLESVGDFSLHEMDPSWSTKLLLGVYDYYSLEEVSAFQVMPDQQKMTLDVPDMTNHYLAESAGGWRWLSEPWPYDIAEKSKAVTNLDALLGYPITEVLRWEKDQWEMFSGAGPDVDPADIRTIPLGTLLGEDETLEMVIKLKINEGIWRDDRDSPWNCWE